MDYQVLYTDTALSDLEEITSSSWDEYPGSTERFAASLLNHIDLLKSFPRLGEPISGFPGVRRLLHSPLHVYYRLSAEKKRVEILRFWHSARRPLKLSR